MLAGLERRDGELAVSAGRRRDRDGVEIVAPDQLQRVGVHVPNAGGLRGLRCLLAVPAAQRRDFPAFGLQAGNVDLRAKADADNADLAFDAGTVRSVG